MRFQLRVALVAALGVTACHRAPAPQSPARPAMQAATVKASEANVVAIILAANNTDLSYARLVPDRARSSAVKTFAQRMQTDHSILNDRVRDIALRNGINAEDNEVSLDFRDHSAQRRDILRELSGARFDSTYAANEISYHTELLEAIDKVLLPNTRTAELREFVAQLKPAVSAHLAHAEQMKASLVGGK